MPRKSLVWIRRKSTIELFLFFFFNVFYDAGDHGPPQIPFSLLPVN